jgi:septal ring factor EnvC (AmiA/AmiB activator)
MIASEFDEPVHVVGSGVPVEKRARSIAGMFELRRSVPLLAIGLLCAALAAAQSEKRAETEAELKAVRSEIARIKEQVEKDQMESDRLAKELRTAEVSVSSAREQLDEIRRERAERNARRKALAEERRVREEDIARERSALAGQMRAAYLIGREEPLKLLLNQKDPTRAGRMFAYYSYFGRARAGQIDRIEADVRKLEELDMQLEQEETRLAELETERRDEVKRLEGARTQRRMVLATLKAESRNRSEALERLQKEQAGLEKLVKQLRRAIEKFPVDSTDAFARVKGKLAWPVAGKIVAKFGEQRAGGVKWDGVLLSTARGSPVRAVYHGRVVFADWLPGLGLLTIVDHGQGYLSLYGHNERLYKEVGEKVTAGDTIATAGDTGGSSGPELYFEIRKSGRPMDPRPWFKASNPTG